MFTPTTNLRLLSTPLESDYRNTLWFPNVATQTAYFTGKTVKTYASFNYIKKDNTIVVPDEVDNLYNCNYIMYQNSNFSGRWFYAFINRIEWASNNSTRLYVSTDVIQTWFFDITYYQSYVDRCHSDTDVAGDNIVPEDFTTGDNGGYQIAGTIDLTPTEIAVFATSNAASGGVSSTGTVVNGIFTGAQPVLDGVSITNISNLKTLLDSYVNNGTATAVARIQQYPPVASVSGGKLLSFQKRPTSINGYTPTNKKLLSGAFISCFISMYGQESTVNPEFLSSSIVALKVVADKTNGMISAFITNYSADSGISNFSVSASIPESSWAYNQYKNEYNLHSGSNGKMQTRLGRQRTANVVNSSVGLASSAIAGISALAGLGIGGISDPAHGLLSAISQGYNSANELINNAAGIDEISQQLATIQENYNAPATGTVASSTPYICAGECALTYGYKVPPVDLVKRCDKYLSVYGYKQSIYRNINLHSRLNWTFIKTVGLNASGNFPDDDMKAIKRIFDNGIFFWAYTATFGNFDQANPIV